MQGFDASMGPLSAVSSVQQVHVYCLAMARRMPDWLRGSDSMRKYVVPHCMRKLWMRVQGLCDQGAWRTAAAGSSGTPAGLNAKNEEFFRSLSLNELLDLCPDSAAYMKCLPDSCPIRVLKHAFIREHPLMVCEWACVLHDVTSKLGTRRCLNIAQVQHDELNEALDALLLTHGAGTPPNFHDLFCKVT